MTAYAAPSAWYTHYGDGSTTGYYAVTKRPQNSAVSAGALVRQFTTPSVNNERVFACVVAGTTANTTDATWTLTKGAKSTDGTATWIEVTGHPGRERRPLGRQLPGLGREPHADGRRR